MPQPSHSIHIWSIEMAAIVKAISLNFMCIIHLIWSLRKQEKNYISVEIFFLWQALAPKAYTVFLLELPHQEAHKWLMTARKAKEEPRMT